MGKALHDDGKQNDAIGFRQEAKEVIGRICFSAMDNKTK